MLTDIFSWRSQAKHFSSRYLIEADDKGVTHFWLEQKDPYAGPKT
jgi:hypothetical protein